MFEAMKPYILTFIPIFVAVDAIGNIPVFISLVDGISKKQKQTAIRDSVFTATAVAILFMFIGKQILAVLGVTIPDFQVAGGLLLFIIAMRLLLPGTHKAMLFSEHDRDVGVFPLGTPLITGPAVLTTTLIMQDAYGIVPTFISLALNMLFVWFTLAQAERIVKTIGSGGTRAISKIMYILLAAIGVMMVRRGVTSLFMR